MCVCVNLQPSWVTDEEFGMGYLELKPAPSVAAKSSVGNLVAIQSGSAINGSQNEYAGVKTVVSDSSNSVKDQILKVRPADGRTEKAENVSSIKSDPGNVKLKGGSLINGTDAQSSVPSAGLSSGASRSLENLKQVDDSMNRADENIAKVAQKNILEPEVAFEFFAS